MFASPPVLTTKRFAELPAEQRRADRPSHWAAGQPNVGAIHSLLEGPGFTRDGRFFCVDVAHGRIFQISQEGRFTVAAEYDGWPNGLRIHKDGRIFIADNKNGVMLFDPERGTVAPLIERYRGERFRGVNDLTFAANGDLYFTDQGLTGLHDAAGRVYRYSAGGELSLLLDRIPSPNGLVLSRDGSELYLAVTRDNAIWRVPLLADGGVTKVGRFIQMSGGQGPDGLAIDTDGNLLVAHVGFGCVWQFSPLGEPLLRIQSCAGLKTTNVAFGGAENRTLFITEAESGSILTVELPIPGEQLYSHR
jgi:gluconolactonase